jgi:hypothetical protein
LCVPVVLDEVEGGVGDADGGGGDADG